jgi:hypothetical protein
MHLCVADRAGARPAEAAACFDAVTDEVLADNETATFE